MMAFRPDLDIVRTGGGETEGGVVVCYCTDQKPAGAFEAKSSQRPGLRKLVVGHGSLDDAIFDDLEGRNGVVTVEARSDLDIEVGTGVGDEDMAGKLAVGACTK